MPRDIDALASATLKHLRDRWWDDAFTQFLRESLHPVAGNRILDVGCGVGTAELQLGLRQLSQVRLCAVDLVVDRARAALAETRARNIRVGVAAADAVALPFADRSFDSTFCVAVLQHVRDAGRALAEFVRVTKPGGRILAVEPDTRARYWHSSLESGRRAYELSVRFFTALADARGEASDPAIGPDLPGAFSRHGIEPLAVHLFPVSVARLGAPAPGVWAARRQAVRRAIELAPAEAIRRLGADYLRLLDAYAGEAAATGPAFVEIQNTLLFATIGMKNEE